MSDSFGSSHAPVCARIAERAPAGFIIIGDHDHSNPGSGRLGDAALNRLDRSTSASAAAIDLPRPMKALRPTNGARQPFDEAWSRRRAIVHYNPDS